MWRLIVFILICALFLIFIVFNQENKSDISFGFKTYKDIPVFITSFSSFLVGMLFAAFFALSLGRKHKKSSHGPSHDSQSSGETNAAGPKKWWAFGKKGKTSNIENSEKDAASHIDEVKKERSPYGID